VHKIKIRSNLTTTIVERAASDQKTVINLYRHYRKNNLLRLRSVGKERGGVEDEKAAGGRWEGMSRHRPGVADRDEVEGRVGRRSASRIPPSASG
jgi:hypothetical protein